MPSRRIRDPQAFAEEAADACARLIGQTPTGIDWPASRSRRSVRLRLDGGSVIATRRKSVGRSELEAGVMRVLNANGAAVPAVLAYDGVWMIQEDLGGTRLAELLRKAEDGNDHEAAWALLESAAESLRHIHEIGDRTGLSERVVRLGASPDWVGRLVDMPARIGAALDLPPPDLDRDALTARLALDVPCLLKWDARPGNAVVRADGRIAWFDWEHSGTRNAMDDFAWLLADEYVGGLTGLEAVAVDNAPVTLPDEAARTYFCTYAVFHTAVRLALIVDNLGDGDWWDEGKCLKEDRVRVTPGAVRGLAVRGAAWADSQRETAPLARWFEAVPGRMGL